MSDDSARRDAYTSKLRRIRALASEVPELSKHGLPIHDFDRKYSLLYDCQYGFLKRAVTREPGRRGKAGMVTFRCALFHRCPSCMNPWRILAARRSDYVAAFEAIKHLVERNTLECYVLAGVADRPITLKRLERKIRAVGIAGGDWGAELAFMEDGKRPQFRQVSTTWENWGHPTGTHPGPIPPNPCLINALVVIRPILAPKGAILGRPAPDFHSLGAKVTIERYSRLAPAWESYLGNVARVLEAAPAEDIVSWMFDNHYRTFRGLGALKGAKHRYLSLVRADRQAKGLSTPLIASIFDEREHHEPVEKRTEKRAPEVFPTLREDHRLSQFMAEARPLIRQATDKPDDHSTTEAMAEMTADERAAYDAEQSEMRRLKRIIGEEDNRESRLPSPSKWTQ